MREIGRLVADWEGGTRIGESLKTLLDGWSQRAALRGAVVVLCSDGLERGDPALLRAQMARLRRLAHRVVWANPLKGSPQVRAARARDVGGAAERRRVPVRVTTSRASRPWRWSWRCRGSATTVGSGSSSAGSASRPCSSWRRSSYNAPMKETIGHAEDTLRVAQAAAQRIHDSGGSFGSADAAALASADPSHTYREGTTPSIGLDDVSVATALGLMGSGRPGATGSVLLPPPDRWRRGLLRRRNGVHRLGRDERDRIRVGSASGHAGRGSIEQLDRMHDLHRAADRAQLRGELHRASGVRAGDDRRPGRRDRLGLRPPERAGRLGLGDVVDPGRTTTAIAVANLDQTAVRRSCASRSRGSSWTLSARSAWQASWYATVASSEPGCAASPSVRRNSVSSRTGSSDPGRSSS